MRIFIGKFLHCPDTAGTAVVEYHSHAGMVVDDHGVIVALDDLSVLIQSYPAAQVVDYSEFWILPGFLDTHIHFPQMDIIGGMAGALLPWLEKCVYPEEIHFKGRGRNIIDASNLFVDELLRNGTTLAAIYSSSDYEATDTLCEVIAQRGLRSIVGKTSMNLAAPSELLVAVEQDLREQQKLLSRWHRHDQRIFLALTPRFAPSCTSDMMTGLAQLHRQYPDSYLQTHYAENIDELSLIKKLFPKAQDYLAVYERFDLIGARTILAHGIHVDRPSMKRLAQHRAVISHCPTSNLFLGSGLFSWQDMHRAGVNVTLGTDVGAGTSYSLWQTMNEAYKVSALKGAPVAAEELFYAATRGAALALGLNHLGAFVPGMQADFQVIDAQQRPLLMRRLVKADSAVDCLAALIHLCDDRNVNSVWVAGQKIYDHGRL